MRRAPPARRVALGLAFGAAAWMGLARAAEPPAPLQVGEADQATTDYIARLKTLAAQRLPELETTSREAFDRAPCVRAELAVWLSIAGDGSISDAHADEGSGHPGDVREVVAANVKAWRLPPPPGGKATRLRLPLGMVPSAPIPARLNCDAEILDVGDYHVTQLEPGTERGKWRAVCKSGDPASQMSAVQAIKVSLKRFRDREDDADEKTGRRVSAKGCDAPAFLFKNVAGVVDGPLPPAKVTVQKDGKTDVSLGNATYRLGVQSQPASGDAAEPRPWKIILDAGGATEVLDVGSSTQPHLLIVRWAGDLDGDGRPDFALEDRDDGVALRLYISSAAVGGRRVRQVATTVWGGL